MFDLNLLVLDSDIDYKYPHKSAFEIITESEREYTRYAEIWPYVTRSKGRYYRLGKHDEEVDVYFHAFDFFKSEKYSHYKPYWITDKRIFSDLTTFILKRKYEEDFMGIVQYYLSKSQSSTVLLLGRYQSDEREVVCGTITLFEFETLLYDGKLSFNTCYIISDQPRKTENYQKLSDFITTAANDNDYDDEYVLYWRDEIEKMVRNADHRYKRPVIRNVFYPILSSGQAVDEIIKIFKPKSRKLFRAVQARYDSCFEGCINLHDSYLI